MSNDRKGWLTREQVEEIETATKDAVRSGNIIEMVDHQEVLALTRMALAALDARENPLVLETAFKMVQDAHAKPKPVEAECPCGGDGVIVCGKSMEGDYLEKPCPIHAPKPAPTTEVCAVCGEPKSYYAHRERYLGHPFTPAPKEQRP